jgi:hypothetical protein
VGVIQIIGRPIAVIAPPKWGTLSIGKLVFGALEWDGVGDFRRFSASEPRSRSLTDILEGKVGGIDGDGPGLEFGATIIAKFQIGEPPGVRNRGKFTLNHVINGGQHYLRLTSTN